MTKQQELTHTNKHILCAICDLKVPLHGYYSSALARAQNATKITSSSAVDSNGRQPFTANMRLRIIVTAMMAALLPLLNVVD